MQLTPEGWTLLKTWEGCRLSAYPDPASGDAPWTISYGHTGPDVAPGLSITQQHAEAFLQKDVAHAASGIPCPVGWLHKGSAASPTGGGHWSLVIGWDPETRHLLMHDPNGEADLVNGGYVNQAINSGKSLRYSERNWGRRWQVEGAGSGWWIQISPAH
jgi:hypothetical protein